MILTRPKNGWLDWTTKTIEGAQALSRLDCAPDTFRNAAAIEGHTGKPSPKIKYPDRGCRVDQSAGHLLTVARRDPRINGDRGIIQTRLMVRVLAAQETSYGTKLICGS